LHPASQPCQTLRGLPTQRADAARGPLRRVVTTLAWLGAALYLSPSLAADATLSPNLPGPADANTVTPYVGLSSRYDDNLLRLDSAARARLQPGSTSTSDNVQNVFAGVRFDQQIARQRVLLDLNLNHQRFDHYRQFDHTGRLVKGQWNWHAFDDLEGTVVSRYTLGLAPFDAVRSAARVLQQEHFNLLEARYLATPSWQLRGAANRYSVAYDVAPQSAYDFALDAVEAGVDYLPATGSSIGLQAGHSRGKYGNGSVTGAVPVNNDYTQNELKSRLLWAVSPQTRIQLLGGYVERRQAVASVRDYRGVNVRLSDTWAPTVKLGVTASIYRELGAAADVNANYSLNQGISLASAWDMTAVLRVEATAAFEKRGFNDVSTLQNAVPQARDDKLQRYGIAATYRPTQHWKLSASLFRHVTDSTIPTLASRAQGGALGAVYAF
jgi:exopolysaccharide biosynthesis operon protein EpsL